MTSPAIGSPVFAFPYMMPELTQITPFSYRDGMTYAKMVEGLRHYINQFIVPEFNSKMEEIITEFQAGITNAENTIIQTKGDWQGLFDAFMANFEAEILALNDVGFAGIIENPESQSSIELHKIFATIAQLALTEQDVSEIQETLGGRLSVESISETIDSETTGLQLSTRRAYSVKENIYDGVTTQHVVTKLYNALTEKVSIGHVMGADSLSPTATKESVASFYNRTGANIIINASGFWDTDRFMGLIIKDGVLIQDWDYLPVTDWGVESVVFFDDGHVEMLSRDGESGAELVERGAWNSFTQGRIALLNNTDMGLRSNPKYQGVTGRQCIGIDNDNNIVILTFQGKTDVYGATIQDVYNIASVNNIHSLYMLDGGGSTQLMVEGSTVVPSSDAVPRALGDVLTFNGSRVDGYYGHSDWQPVVLSGGVTAIDASYTGSSNSARIVTHGNHKRTVLRINVKGVVSGGVVGTLPRAEMWPKVNASIVGVSNGGLLVGMNINQYGNITVVSSGLTAANVIRGEWEFTLG